MLALTSGSPAAARPGSTLNLRQRAEWDRQSGEVVNYLEMLNHHIFAATGRFAVVIKPGHKCNLRGCIAHYGE